MVVIYNVLQLVIEKLRNGGEIYGIPVLNKIYFLDKFRKYLSKIFFINYLSYLIMNFLSKLWSKF